MDHRARQILDIARHLQPRLASMLGAEAPAVDRAITQAITSPSNQASERLRQRLMSHPQTRSYLLELMPDARAPRPLRGDEQVHHLEI